MLRYDSVLDANFRIHYFSMWIIMGMVLVEFGFLLIASPIVPRTLPKCTDVCEFKKSSLNFEGAPTMPLFVWLNSWDLLRPIFLQLPQKLFYRFLLIVRNDCFRSSQGSGCSSWPSRNFAATFRLFLSVVVSMKSWTDLKNGLIFNIFTRKIKWKLVKNGKNLVLPTIQLVCLSILSFLLFIFFPCRESSFLCTWQVKVQKPRKVV